jgi:hypothetical protein
VLSIGPTPSSSSLAVISLPRAADGLEDELMTLFSFSRMLVARWRMGYKWRGDAPDASAVSHRHGSCLASVSSTVSGRRSEFSTRRRRKAPTDGRHRPCSCDPAAAGNGRDVPVPMIAAAPNYAHGATGRPHRDADRRLHPQLPPRPPRPTRLLDKLKCPPLVC